MACTSPTKRVDEPHGTAGTYTSLSACVDLHDLHACSSCPSRSLDVAPSHLQSSPSRRSPPQPHSSVETADVSAAYYRRNDLDVSSLLMRITTWPPDSSHLWAGPARNEGTRRAEHEATRRWSAELRGMNSLRDAREAFEALMPEKEWGDMCEEAQCGVKIAMRRR